MRLPTSIPRMYAQFRRYVFENEKKNSRNPRESAERKSPGSAR